MLGWSSVPTPPLHHSSILAFWTIRRIPSILSGPCERPPANMEELLCRRIRRRTQVRDLNHGWRDRERGRERCRQIRSLGRVGQNGGGWEALRNRWFYESKGVEGGVWGNRSREGEKEGKEGWRRSQGNKLGTGRPYVEKGFLFFCNWLKQIWKLTWLNWLIGQLFFSVLVFTDWVRQQPIH